MALMSKPSAIIFIWCIIALIGSSTAIVPKPVPYSVPFNRTVFPSDFLFGAGSAAYQSEGAARAYGKGLSIWDTYTKNHPGKIADASTGDVADDFYHRYKEDIHLMKKIGLDSFRFSIAWSRVLPRGKVSRGVNTMGVQFYNDLINELLSKGIVPFVTLFHWDTPQVLEDEYGGLRGPEFVNDFKDYADFCFKTFGDRVKHWVTFNEPISVSMNGYTIGTFAPGRCSKYIGTCETGNSGTEPYVVAHRFLIAHATAAQLYRQKYQGYQKGKIGITLASHWIEPKFNTEADQKAALRILDFMFGWFIHPLTYGDYPPTMRPIVGHRLPNFTQSESSLVKGSMDFLGLNYYTTQYAEVVENVNKVNLSYTGDWHAILSTSRNGVAVGTPTALNWLFICPKGIESLLLYIKKNYSNPEIYITENGVADLRNDSIPVQEAIKDAVRIRYHDAHLRYLAKSIRQGVNVKGYYLWSFLDDFEWDAGYTVRFGITYIDFKDGLKRYLKYSAYWLKRFLLK
uniref:Beta-glucosidase n=1 Tax=Kalanchoe fedtschenkoi TaxID=63787 RepID=A0A7N0SX14_KALFE